MSSLIITQGYGGGANANITPTAGNPKRQQIIDAVKARLALISVANGYKTALGARIDEWRVSAIDPVTELPNATVRDTSDTVAVSFGEWKHLLRLEISAYVTGAATPAGVRNVIADIHKAFGVDITFGGLTQDVKIIDEKIETEMNDRIFTGVSLMLEIEYVTLNWNPYE